MHSMVLELLERKVEATIRERGEYLRPQFKAIIDRMRVSNDSREMAKLMEEVTALLRQYEGTGTLRGRWNAIKAMFKK